MPSPQQAEKVIDAVRRGAIDFENDGLISIDNSSVDTPLAGNPMRVEIFLQNQGTEDITVGLGRPEMGEGEAITLSSGETTRWHITDTGAGAVVFLPLHAIAHGTAGAQDLYVYATEATGVR